MQGITALFIGDRDVFQKIKSLDKKKAIPLVIGLIIAAIVAIFGVKYFFKMNPQIHSGRLPVVEAEMTQAPQVPKPLNRDYPVRNIVRLEVTETIKTIAPGVNYKYWSYNGSTPGPFIRVREGDEVEVHLKNPSTERMPHSVDFHAVSGENGGKDDTEAMPGTETTMVFTATKPGLYLYHCGSMPSPAIHVAKGMYGLILVEPKEGMDPVDREYFIVQSELYLNTNGDAAHGEVNEKVANNDPNLATLDFQKASKEQPDYVVFNGAEGTLVGSRGLQAKVGERIRLYVGNAGPNLNFPFHIMGKILDTVYVEGGKLINHNVQTTDIPAGGAAIIEVNMDTPGDFMILDHALMRSMKGAMGDLIVEGRKNFRIFQGQTGVTSAEE